MQNTLLSAQAASAGRVFALDSQTLIGIAIQLINAVILAVVLGFMLYNPVKDFMRKRKQSESRPRGMKQMQRWPKPTT